ncbi:MAG: flagellar hook-associated protein FlgK [Oligoflexales bacterium]|nr:flagellar hook-associated protein FlgK [Oligoflexales bacterium]
MTGIFHSLNIGSEALHVNRQGIDTTAHNIANAQTESYSRQDLKIGQRDPNSKGKALIGNGNYVQSVDRSRDMFIEKQINKVSSGLGLNEGKKKILAEIEGVFSPELRSSVAEEMSAFFSSLQTLAEYPEEITVRTSVKERGENLAAAFRSVDHDLKRIRGNINEELKGLGMKVSDQLKSIASLNLKIRELETGNQSQANDLRDQRDQLVRKLSEAMNIQYYDDQYGMTTIRGPSETLLVDKGSAATLDIALGEDKNGMYDVLYTPKDGGVIRDITKAFSGGQFKGLLESRDQVTKHIMDQNNELARTFTHEINKIHKEGFGLGGFGNQNGTNFFQEVENPEEAAALMSIDSAILNSTDAIAAASLPGAAGDNININRMLNLKSEKLLEDGAATLNEFYANSMGALGIQSQRVENVLESDKILLADLKSRGEAIAGVSLDEEATNMIRWQTAFTASSKVITTADQMLQTILELKR